MFMYQRLVWRPYRWISIHHCLRANWSPPPVTGYSRCAEDKYLALCCFLLFGRVVLYLNIAVIHLSFDTLSASIHHTAYIYLCNHTNKMMFDRVLYTPTLSWNVFFLIPLDGSQRCSLLFRPDVYVRTWNQNHLKYTEMLGLQTFYFWKRLYN